MSGRRRRALADYARAVNGHSGCALQMRIWLLGIEPPVWRRFVVPGAMPARDLVRVAERVMGWSGGHLSELHFPRPAGSPRRPLLVAERLEVGDRLRYVYDLGDCWHHELEVEALVEKGPGGPLVLTGARACPPEDCGGVEGYDRVLALVARPRLSEDRGRRRWLAEMHPGWSPERFDMAAINRRLKGMKIERVNAPPGSPGVAAAPAAARRAPKGRRL
jgi:hypothetical protein